MQVITCVGFAPLFLKVDKMSVYTIYKWITIMSGSLST